MRLARIRSRLLIRPCAQNTAACTCTPMTKQETSTSHFVVASDTESWFMDRVPKPSARCQALRSHTQWQC